MNLFWSLSFPGKRRYGPFTRPFRSLGPQGEAMLRHGPAVGTKEEPQAARAQIDTDPCLFVFSDLGRIEDFIAEGWALGHLKKRDPLPVISIPAAAAMAWSVKCRARLFVNPGEDSALIPLEQVEAFHAEWSERGGRQASGFWIPNLTTKEEDFWQENGL
jgi:hypothetical protein